LYGGLLRFDNRVIVTAGAASSYANGAYAEDGDKHPDPCFPIFHFFFTLKKHKNMVTDVKATLK
jgi:hypothetical protein